MSLDVFDQVVDVALGAGKRGVSFLPVRNLLNTESCLIQSADAVLMSFTKSARLTLGCRPVRM